jgi:hypothetical protein
MRRRKKGIGAVQPRIEKIGNGIEDINKRNQL